MKQRFRFLIVGLRVLSLAAVLAVGWLWVFRTDVLLIAWQEVTNSEFANKAWSGDPEEESERSVFGEPTQCETIPASFEFAEVMLSSIDDRYERRVAFVAGVGAYNSISELRNPASDARAVSDRLADLGFDVMLLVDPDEVSFRKCWSRFVSESAGADMSALFYSGHGIQLSERSEAGSIVHSNYLLMRDVSLNRRKSFGYVKLDELLRDLVSIGGQSIVLLDACRSDPSLDVADEVRIAGAKKMGASKGWAPVDVKSDKAFAGADVLIAYASAPGNVAYDSWAGLPGHSPFASALLEYLGKSGASLSSTMSMVSDSVQRVTEGNQVPWTNTSVRKPIYLNGELGNAETSEVLSRIKGDFLGEVLSEYGRDAEARSWLEIALKYEQLINVDEEFRREYQIVVNNLLGSSVYRVNSSFFEGRDDWFSNIPLVSPDSSRVVISDVTADGFLLFVRGADQRIIRIDSDCGDGIGRWNLPEFGPPHWSLNGNAFVVLCSVGRGPWGAGIDTVRLEVIDRDGKRLGAREFQLSSERDSGTGYSAPFYLSPNGDRVFYFYSAEDKYGSNFDDDLRGGGQYNYPPDGTVLGGLAVWDIGTDTVQDYLPLAPFDREQPIGEPGELFKLYFRADSPGPFAFCGFDRSGQMVVLFRKPGKFQIGSIEISNMTFQVMSELEIDDAYRSIDLGSPVCELDPVVGIFRLGEDFWMSDTGRRLNSVDPKFEGRENYQEWDGRLHIKNTLGLSGNQSTFAQVVRSPWRPGEDILNSKESHVIFIVNKSVEQDKFNTSVYEIESDYEPEIIWNDERNVWYVVPAVPGPFDAIRVFDGSSGKEWDVSETSALSAGDSIFVVADSGEILSTMISSVFDVSSLSSHDLQSRLSKDERSRLDRVRYRYFGEVLEGGTDD